MSESKRLYRSQDIRMIGGVCGGLGKYFAVDPVLVRLVFVALGLVNGLGVLIYFIMWLVIPDENNRELPGEDVVRANFDDISQQARRLGGSVKEGGYGVLFVGVLLIALGAIFLLKDVLPWMSPALIWPIVLIIIGGYLLLRHR